LLLGASDSGKSTLFKQMKIIQEDGGYTNQELREYRELVYENIISQMNRLLDLATEDLVNRYNNSNATTTTTNGTTGISLNASCASTSSSSLSIHPTTLFFDDNLNFERSLRVRHAGQIVAQGGSLSTWSSVVQDIKQLWSSNEVQNQIVMSENGSKYFQLNDSATYFLNNLDFYSNEDFVPTEQDVLRVRQNTTSITEANFSFRGLNFKMVDVGGQKSLRRKWIHCFDNVSSVIFVASLISYYQTLEEESSTSRLEDSVELFGEIANSPLFDKSVLVLFLNKKDLFQEKLKKIPLSKYYPAFGYGNSGSTKEAAKFISRLFLDRLCTKRPVYLHLTCAVDTTNVKFVFQSVTDDLLKKILELF